MLYNNYIENIYGGNSLMGHQPIIHGVPTNETPTKCLTCACRVQEDNRWICKKNVSAKIKVCFCISKVLFGSFVETRRIHRKNKQDVFDTSH